MFHIAWWVLLLLHMACKKEPDQQPSEQGSLRIQLTHDVKGQALVYDTLIYTNHSGNTYSVSKLHYYISAIRLMDVTHTITFQSNGIYYINARHTSNTIIISGIPKGTYQSIAFFIGIDTLQNISNSLQMNFDNMEMVWPDEMGGGYHFLKLEGRYMNANQLSRGYAMHSGNNMALTRHQPITCDIQILNQQETTISLAMDVNSWFDSPVNYDLLAHGNYTMGIDKLMVMIANNGKDVFYKK
jgi:hypothetical protein